jgi:acetyl-CoA carboxylase biotin carboxylase subunit
MNNFLPDIGKLITYKRPEGNGVRVDDGFEQGMDVPIYYDPMISKLITHGKDREEAIQRMLRAITEYQITGITTTLGFCRFTLNHEKFLDGTFDTNFVKNYFDPKYLINEDPIKMELVAKIAAGVFEELGKKKGHQITEGGSCQESPWRKNRTN